MRIKVYLHDKTREQLFDLGNYNEGDATMLQILSRVYRKKHLDKMCECVPDYNLVVGEQRFPLQVIREVMMK